MSDQVTITLIVCVTMLLAIWMTRSAILRLVAAKKDSFTFAVRFFGAGMWLFRGDHKPTPESLPKPSAKTTPSTPADVVKS